jgi:hypothetical protein
MSRALDDVVQNIRRELERQERLGVLTAAQRIRFAKPPDHTRAYERPWHGLTWGDICRHFEKVALGEEA